VKRSTTLALVTALVLSGCTAGPVTPASRPGPAADRSPAVLGEDLVLVGSLTGFDACDDYLAHVQERALEIVTPWGLGDRWAYEVDGEEMDAGDAEDDAGAPVPSEALVDGEDFSGTNVQEVGVDEPDHVKTDGRTMYVVTHDRLQVVDVTGDEPAELASVEVREAWDAQLLLEGDRLLVTSSTYGMIPFAGERISADVLPPGGWGGTTTITLLDVSDPAEPVAVERLTVDGATLSSRLVDGVARVVVRTEQGNLPWVHPEGSGIRAERRALEANRELIRGSVAEDWIPWFVHETAEGRQTEGPLLACNRIAHPREFAGLGVLTVLTVDLAGGGLAPGTEALGVLAGGDTVYASRGTLYVATTTWVDWERLSDRARERREEQLTTEIHAFGIADPRAVTYLGSGEVPGTLLSQWAMSEHEEVLRVASTVGDVWGWGSRPSESVVTTLRLDDGALVQTGQVTGLGVTERIYAVRFIGDVGYVVTFRETDPLYTLDLSDPRDPRVVGELKILGYSAYLHPVGDDLLLGVGQDADLEGRTLGTQLSLFDVSDPADPQRIDQVTLGSGSSEVEYDHRAFLHWGPTGLTVVPFVRWDVLGTTGWEELVAGAVGFTADRDEGLQRLGLLSHRGLLRDAYAGHGGEDWLEGLTGDEEPGTPDEDRTAPPEEDWLTDETDEPAVSPPDPGRWGEWSWQTQIRRSVVIGDRLLTVSDLGIVSHDLDTLEDLGSLLFDVGTFR
jgi:hypothetical protein